MTTLNAYLERLYHTENEKTATDLEHKFSKMSPDELLKIAVGDTPAGQDKLRRLGQRVAERKQSIAKAGLSGSMPAREALAKGQKASQSLTRVFSRLKTGSAEADKLAWADNWGRALAQMEKEAGRLDTMKESFDIGRHQNKVDRVRAILDLGPDTGGGFSGAPIPEAVAHHLGRHHRKYLAGAGLTLGGLALHRALKKDKPEAEKTSAAGCKTSDFTTPEAQEKAKVVQQALKSTKGAPAHVRKAAVKVTAEKLKQASKA